MESWEDWETEEPEVIFVNTEAQAKREEERKLIEESETALAHALFHSTANPPAITTSDKKRPVTNKPKNISKQKENEQKQKDASNAAKLTKAMKQREREIFGEAYEDELDVQYDDYY